MKPSAMILMTHSVVKMTVKMTSVSSRNSLVAFVSPLGRGVNTARDIHVPTIARRMKYSNHLASVTCMKNCRMGFFNEKRYMDRLALSGGGLTPGLRVGFFMASAFS